LSRIEKRYFGIWLQALLVLAWVPTAWHRSTIWEDQLTLWVRSSKESPATPRMQANIIAATYTLPHVKKFFEIDPKTHYVTVKSSVPLDQLDSVTRTFEEVNRMFPNDVRLAKSLAFC